MDITAFIVYVYIYAGVVIDNEEVVLEDIHMEEYNNEDELSDFITTQFSQASELTEEEEDEDDMDEEEDEEEEDHSSPVYYPSDFRTADYKVFQILYFMMAFKLSLSIYIYTSKYV